jgi:hypothetical protein
MLAKRTMAHQFETGGHPAWLDENELLAVPAGFFSLIVALKAGGVSSIVRSLKDARAA